MVMARTQKWPQMQGSHKIRGKRSKKVKVNLVTWSLYKSVIQHNNEVDKNVVAIVFNRTLSSPKMLNYSISVSM